MADWVSGGRFRVPAAGMSVTKTGPTGMEVGEWWVPSAPRRAASTGRLRSRGLPWHELPARDKQRAGQATGRMH